MNGGIVDGSSYHPDQHNGDNKAAYVEFIIFPDVPELILEGHLFHLLALYTGFFFQVFFQ